MNVIASIAIACVVVLAVAVYCAIVLSARSDEQDRKQLQGDAGGGSSLDSEAHR